MKTKSFFDTIKARIEDKTMQSLRDMVEDSVCVFDDETPPLPINTADLIKEIRALKQDTLSSSLVKAIIVDEFIKANYELFLQAEINKFVDKITEERQEKEEWTEIDHSKVEKEN